VPALSVTRFKLKSRNPAGIALFLWHTFRSARQAQATPGFLGGELVRDAELTFWTITLWQNHEVMRAFRNQGDHQRALRAMRTFDRYCSEAAVLTYEHTSSGLPEVHEVCRRLQDQGRFYDLSEPSKDHRNRTLRPPSNRGSTSLRPKAVATPLQKKVI
jgi:heme-degrading monooxygenase HmoA